MNTFVIKLFLGLFLLCGIPAFAQNDSMKTEYSEESARTSDYTFKEKYKYLTRARIEERSMFKLGLASAAYFTRESQGNSTSGSFNSSILAELAFEKKISTSFSLVSSNKLAYSFPSINQLTLGIGPRYYHRLKQRIRQGRNADNLSENYLGALYQYHAINSSGMFKNNSSLYVSYGWQRRLGRFGNLDFNIGPKFYLGRKPNPGSSIINLDFYVIVGFGL